MKKIQQIENAVKKYRNLIENTEQFLWTHPELGYKEWAASTYLMQEFEHLGYQVQSAGDIPGFIADLDTGRPGPRIAIMGELDSLICETHPDANPTTKAVHACGHHCQGTILLGCAAICKEKWALEGLCGSVRFVAVPAEETIDAAYRKQLIENGIIHYLAGKIEFLYRGYLDDVDLAILIHTGTFTEHLFELPTGYDGCIIKHFEYQGVAAHAGGAPHLGINALYAASLGLNAINALRETFCEKDYVRVHPIITQAGVAANAIPELAKLDSYVRAATLDGMKNTNNKVNRALAATAAAMGANVVIQDSPGNMPFHADILFMQEFEQCVEEWFGKNQVVKIPWRTETSDVGDISTIMPMIQPLCAGASGIQHGDNYYITDLEKACINPIKVLVLLVNHLLEKEASCANRIIDEYRPVFPGKEAYFQTIDGLKKEWTAVAYHEDGNIELRI